MRKLAITIGCILICLPLLAQPSLFSNRDTSPAFNDGEVLHYVVSYSNKVMSVNVADVELTTSIDEIWGQTCYKINGVGNTRPFFNIFFTLRDVYTSYLDIQTLKPIRATSSQKEGGYEYETDFRYNWDRMVTDNTGHNIKRNVYYKHVMNTEEYSYDALSLFYNLRTIDVNQIKNIGDKFPVSLVLEDTIRTVYLKYLGKEEYKLNRKVGTFKTLKFSCVFATSTDESFKDGDEFFIWISDDKNKIPIYLESPIKVGKIYARLSEYSNIANPMISKITP